MDTLTLDVRNLPDEKIQQLRQLVESWKQEKPATEPSLIKKRTVDPSEFIVRDSKLKAPYSRALAYEG